MTRPAKDIVNAAIRLPENDRLEIIEELSASLETQSDEDVDAAWAAEVERRSTWPRGTSKWRTGGFTRGGFLQGKRRSDTGRNERVGKSP